MSRAGDIRILFFPPMMSVQPGLDQGGALGFLAAVGPNPAHGPDGQVLGRGRGPFWHISGTQARSHQRRRRWAIFAGATGRIVEQADSSNRHRAAGKVLGSMVDLLHGPGNEAIAVDRQQLSRILPRDTLETDYEPAPYQWNELVTLLCSMEGTKRSAFRFWAFTGLRTSELIALTWADVDLTAMTARIDKAVVEGEEKGMKTKSGTRTISLLIAARQVNRRRRP